MYSLEQIEKDVNKIGGSYKNPYESFRFVSMYRPKGADRYVKIFNAKRGQYFYYRISHLKQGRNPFKLKNGLPVELVKEVVNKLGLKSKNKAEQFYFVSMKYSGRNISVFIRNKKTHRRKKVLYQNLLLSGNPFCLTQDRYEERVIHPLVKRELKKMGFKLIEQEVRLSARSRLDFLCTTFKDKKVIIEVKSDKRKHSKKDLTDQTKKYSIDGRKKFGDKFMGVYLVSLKGLTGGYRLKDLSLVLKQKGVIR